MPFLERAISIPEKNFRSPRSLYGNDCVEIVLEL